MAISAEDIRHEDQGKRGTFFVQPADKRVAELSYSLAGRDLFVDHTYVEPSQRDTGVARMLVEAVVGYARREKRLIIPACPYVKSVFDKTPEYADVRRPPARDDEEDEK